MGGMSNQLIAFWLAAAAALPAVILGVLLTNWSNSDHEQRHRNAAKAAAHEVPKPQTTVSVQIAVSVQITVAQLVAVSVQDSGRDRPPNPL